MNSEQTIDPKIARQEEENRMAAEQAKTDAENESIKYQENLQNEQQNLNTEADILEQENKAREVQMQQYENQENSRLQEIQQSENQQRQAQNATPKEKPIPWLTFQIMLFVAVIADILCFLINLIPVIGGVLEDILLTLPIAFIFWVISKISGVPIFKGLRGVVTSATIVVGFIPVVNAIPKWSFDVLALVAITLAEKAAGKALKNMPKVAKKKISMVANMVPKSIQRQVVRQLPQLAEISSVQQQPQISRSTSRPLPNTIKSPVRSKSGLLGTLVKK